MDKLIMLHALYLLAPAKNFINQFLIMLPIVKWFSGHVVTIFATKALAIAPLSYYG